MFDVGFSELVLLSLIGLLVLGPKRLQTVAAELGKWIGSARRTTAKLYRQLERETKLDEAVSRQRPNLRVVPRSPGVGAPAQAGTNAASTAAQSSGSSDLPKV